jgi:hypothetical protein
MTLELYNTVTILSLLCTKADQGAIRKRAVYRFRAAFLGYFFFRKKK